MCHFSNFVFSPLLGVPPIWALMTILMSVIEILSQWYRNLHSITISNHLQVMNNQHYISISYFDGHCSLRKRPIKLCFLRGIKVTLTLNHQFKWSKIDYSSNGFSLYDNQKVSIKSILFNKMEILFGPS